MEVFSVMNPASGLLVVPKNTKKNQSGLKNERRSVKATRCAVRERAGVLRYLIRRTEIGSRSC